MKVAHPRRQNVIDDERSDGDNGRNNERVRVDVQSFSGGGSGGKHLRPNLINIYTHKKFKV